MVLTLRDMTLGLLQWRITCSSGRTAAKGRHGQAVSSQGRDCSPLFFWFLLLLPVEACFLFLPCTTSFLMAWGRCCRCSCRNNGQLDDWRNILLCQTKYFSCCFVVINLEFIIRKCIQLFNTSSCLLMTCLSSANLIVESTSITDWRPCGVPPPQRGAGSQAVGATRVRAHHQLALLEMGVRLESSYVWKLSHKFLSKELIFVNVFFSRNLNLTNLETRMEK